MDTRPGTLIRWHALKGVLRSSLRGSMRVLDIGGNDGFISSAAAAGRPGLFPVLVDTDMAGLRAARARGRRAVCASALSLPAADGSFDAVLCLDMIEHVKDEGPIMREIARVLKVGGTAVLTTPAGHGVSFPGMGADEAARLQEQWGHIRPGFSRGHLLRICGENGLRVTRTGRYLNVLSRAAYHFLVLHGPMTPAKRRLFRAIAPLESALKWKAQELFVVAVKG